jgi:hypothetical protein
MITSMDRQVDDMNAMQVSAAAVPRARAPRLSPELNEFLRMLDALEGQFSARDGKASSGR